MDRMEEYRALLAELEETPPALEYTVQRAMARRRRRRWGRGLGIPAGSVAAVFAAFVLLVNLSTPFALACGRVPVLRDLAAAVSFSPSLSAAVEHDYVQYVGQSQTDNGYTMTLEYLFPDQGQLLFFATVTGPEEVESVMVSPAFTDGEGKKLGGYSITCLSFAPGELSNAFALIPNSAEEPELPEVLEVTCEVDGRIPFQGSGEDVHSPSRDSGEDGAPDAVFTFRFALDGALLEQRERVEVGRWVELDGNRIRIDALEIYPTHARLTLTEDPDNPEQLQSIRFYLEDGAGRRYESGSSGTGILSLGGSYWCESPFFAEPRTLTLHVTQAIWLEKGREYVTIDLERGAALDPLPEGISVSVHHTDAGQVGLAFIAPEPPGSTEEHMLSYQVGTMEYRTPQGEVCSVDGVSHAHADRLWYNTDDETDLPEGYFVEEYVLEDYPWDTVDWGLYFTRQTTFDMPAAFPVK